MRGLSRLRKVPTTVTITFFQVSMDDASKRRAEHIRNYIRDLPDADFDEADREQMCELIASQFRFPDIPEFAKGQIERDKPTFTQGSAQVSVTVYFPYKGDVSLFELFHRTKPALPPAPRFGIGEGVLIKTYQIDREHLQQIDDRVEKDIELVEKFLNPVREAAPLFNRHLSDVTRNAFDARVHELKQNREALDTLSQSRMVLRKRSDEGENVIVPLRRKPIAVGQSSASVDPVREYVLGHAEYDEILKTISSMVKVMERTPSVFAAMDEEPLRTILLVALNGVYEGQASGETFNGYGKTDILIRHDDRNVFIAECLMWKGQAYVRKKMDDQLFQYAMWRDSKLALIVFNRGGRFTKIVETMKGTIKGHPQCINQLEWTHESGARYLFRRHDDQDRHFLLTAMAFDVPCEG